ncbi:hypothetical protein TNCT_98591 [Trichonephila clavata]|uniref:Uncharacterized protein n=1 Tax=Trichonephila clavata TaxID=2740835 RepID=A0A8X6LEU2_TRICU|nr:hypothetical protein TNCT_98591 [Trichonephila clavata]
MSREQPNPLRAVYWQRSLIPVSKTESCCSVNTCRLGLLRTPPRNSGVKGRLPGNPFNAPQSSGMEYSAIRVGKMKFLGSTKAKGRRKKRERNRRILREVDVRDKF